MRPITNNSNAKKNKIFLKQKSVSQNDNYDKMSAYCDTKESNILVKSDNDDLVNLNNLNETIVLDQLKERYSRNKIYTFIGDILIAMNPLKAIPIYSKEISNHYQKTENIRANLSPHVFAIAEQCYREMMRTHQSQCILISGESGSGKTETCKYLVQHLLNRTKPFELCLNSKIQEVNPLLEAFGNAQTRINNNSSRFGKYLEIYFEQDGSVVGAKFKEYLLEKSRVVYQNIYESTFHIFYLLFAGLTVDEKLRYNLVKPPDQYRFMSNTNLEDCMSIENEEKFNAIRESMNTIGFSSEDVESLIKILVSILLIGDISFVLKKGSNNDGVQVKNMDLIEKICELLELDPIELSDALVSEIQITRGEEIKRERNMIQACDVRDALAKAFYGRLFSWIVNQINHHIQPAEGVNSSFSIGLLDIFGFENFERNSFEQMCINLANEQIHQLFTKYIFKLEIQECLDEEIKMSNSDLINYQDNQTILDLFLEKRLGIFALLDEESRFPKATDQSLAIKLHNTLSTAYQDVYIAPKNIGTSFQICHYAGQVLYNVDGFLEKNRDFLPNNLFYVAQNSNDFLVQELFQCKLTRKGTLAPSDRQSRLRKSISINSYNPGQTDTDNITLYSTNEELIQQNFTANRVRFAGSTYTSSLSSMNSYQNSLNKNSKLTNKLEDNNKASINSFVNQYASDKAPLTVACHFKNSLHELIEKINKCKAYFIRCIKPNPNQESVFINEFVTKQLRYCSIMHVCKIRKCGYPYRIKFEEFLKWYKAIEFCILKSTDHAKKSRDLNNNVNEPLERCLKCLEYAKITNYKVGKSKLFLRYWHIDILNSLAKNLETKIIIAQKITRGWLVRNRIKKMQQQETNKFLTQVTNISNNILAKLMYQKSYLLMTNQNKQDTNNQQKSIDKINHKLNSITQMSTSSWPDINEINSTLEEFDLMLNEYEFQNEQIEITKHVSNNTKPTIVSKVSPESVYHLVHNKNNKNDNTLKKRNALVAFEFKTLLDKVIPSYQSYAENTSDEDKLNNEILDLLPSSSPYIYSDANNFNINIPNSDHSPASFSSSSTSSSSSANNSSPSSSSTSSSSSQQIDNQDNFRTVSPSHLVHINSPRVVSPPPSLVSTNYLTSKSQVISSAPLDNKRSNQLNKITTEQTNKKIYSTRPTETITNTRHITSNNNTITSNNNNNNITIWREELNAKKNFQQQLQKQTELAKGIEDSKKNIPEWKKNLLKQKEMKKTIGQTNGSNTNLNNHSETPELMKHNIFVKKVQATKI